MKRIYCLILVSLLLIPGVAAHGDSHEEEESKEGLSLEQIVSITAVIAMLFLGALAYIIKLRDLKLLGLMAFISLIFLIADYLYLKYYYYA